MSNLESLFHKHVKHFVDLEHTNLAVRGYQTDENGYGLATDGKQLLKVKIAEPGEHQVLALNGKPIKDANAPDLNRLIPEHDTIANVDVDTWLDAAATLVAVMKAGNSEMTLVDLVAKEGKLTLTFLLLDGTSGTWEIGESEEDVIRRFDGSRLIQCLKVFQGLTGSVELTGTTTGAHPVLFRAEGIDVLLAPVKRY